MVPGYSNDTKDCKWCNSWMDIDEEFCKGCKKNNAGETLAEVKAKLDEHFMNNLPKIVERFDKVMGKWDKK